VVSEADYAREMELETYDVKRRPEQSPAIGAQPAAKKLMTRTSKDCKHSVAIPDGFDETSRVPDPSLHGIVDRINMCSNQSDIFRQRERFALRDP
jgi:hypothetical protein